MRSFYFLIVTATLLASFASLSVSARNPRNPFGITGVVTTVDTGFFFMKLDKGGTESKVYVNGNTIFQVNGAKSDASQVKAGVHIKLSGTSDDGGKHIEATLVNITGGHKNSKSKSE